MELGTGSSRDRDKKRSPGWARGEWWEWIAIFFAIFALWPKILRWDGIVWDIALWSAVILMVIVFLRRSRRLRKTWNEE